MKEENPSDKEIKPKNKVGKGHDYYKNTAMKIVDFCLGLTFAIAIFLIYWNLNNLIGYILASSAIQIPLIVLILAPIIFFNINRRFVAIGIISLLLLPFLIVGSCIAFDLPFLKWIGFD